MSHYLICGLGGIGAALKTLLEEKGESVHAISTNQKFAQDQNVTLLNLSDPNCEPELIALLNKHAFTHIISTIGFLHDHDNMPEKNCRSISTTWLEKNISANVYPAIHLIKALDKTLNKSANTKALLFSARLGSISDNHLGGWYSYRMSKCMLNMLIKNVSIEWRRALPNVIICGYQPGTVKTALSEPFHIGKNAISPEEAAMYCYEAVNQLKTEDSGHVIDWQNKPIDP